MDQNKNLCDRKFLAKTALYSKLAPNQLEAFSALATSSFEDGELSRMEKELIAVGCAHVLKCPYCIDYHVNLALDAGATKVAIAEATWVGIFVASSSCFGYAKMTTVMLENECDGDYYKASKIDEKDVLTSCKKNLEKFLNLEKSCLESGSLSSNFKLLVAVACAHNTQAPLCIETYVKRSIEAGQSQQTISEAVWIAIEMAAGACFGHSGLTASLLE